MLTRIANPLLLLLCTPSLLLAATLSTPTLTATPVTTTSISLAWSDPNGNEVGYALERSTNGSTFSALKTTAANVTSFVDATVSGTAPYYYRVRAVGNGNSVSAYSNVASAAPKDMIAPTTPTNVGAS